MIDKNLNKISFNSAFIVYCLSIILFLLTGCAQSVINIDTKPAAESYSMLGGESFRNFYYPIILGDSLVEKWQADINGGFSNSSVAVHDHYVFVSDLSGRVYCFDINTGKTAGQLKHKGSVFTSPILHNATLIYAYPENDEHTSEFIVYDFTEGKFVAEEDNISGRALTEMIKVEDGVIFITDNGTIYKYGFRGEKIFEYATKNISHSSPSLKNNILVFGNDEGELIGFDIQRQRLLYREKISDVPLSGVSVSDDISLVGDFNGLLYAVNLNNGEIFWKYNTGKRIKMMPAFDITNVYIGNLGGELFALTKSNGSLLWLAKTDGVLNATPMITENAIFTPDLNKKLHIISKDDGALKKTYWFEGRLKLTPVYINDLLFIGYENGILAAYEVID